MALSYKVRRDHEAIVRCYRPDGEELTPTRSQKLINHSPCGFEVGYGGSGPSQLALAILLDHGVQEPEIWELYHDFKGRYVAAVDCEKGEEVEFPVAMIDAFLEDRGYALPS